MEPNERPMNKLQNLAQRWIFIILSTVIMVFYSEKIYWYIQGYTMLDLILAYLPGVYLTFRIIQYFRIQNFWGLVLAGIAYPLYIEGIFTGIIVSDTTFLVLLSYFIGWHTFLAVIFGWYWHRKWLIERKYQNLIVSSIILGLFWGLWSIFYWTQQQINDPELADVYKAGQWPTWEFALLGLFLTGIYIFSHTGLGLKNIWPEDFKPTVLEDILMGIVLLGLCIIMVITYGFLSILLFLHYSLLFLFLWLYKRKTPSSPLIFKNLTGTITIQGLLSFLLMPAGAILVYWIFTLIQPSENFINTWISEGIPILQGFFGLSLYIIAVVKTIKGSRNSSLDEIHSLK